MKVGIITRDQALEINSEFVAAIESGSLDKRLNFRVNSEVMFALKRGQKALTHDEDSFKIVKVTSVGKDMIWDPKVRVGDGECTWRTDGIMVLL